ncbi:amino acid ABC transporter permease [Nocardiopsis suaedae]|uniref:Amino acid ABC transporter permease n=1 Tax=Nocardiopsis suaedae TaxID=3018444 RepID=A0ABT4TT35_9ACTN|nr:amino acid ABC transporter permease [Nocardiopsis suaedae]MDA2807866.1 amino acid ABC transporter permease [Nocardiopsis suaedae]
MDFVINALPLYWEGALLTIRLTLFGAVLAFVLAVVVGTLGTVRNRTARAVAMVYTEVFRGVAALVLLYWFGYSFVEITGFRLTTEFAAILALGLNIGAYGAEVVRSSINAVPRAQTEAAVALNMTWWRRTRLVVFPQAWAQMLPTFGNLVIELMKATAIVSILGLTDLTKVANDFRASAVADTFTVYAVALVGYFLFAQVLIVLVRLLERRANRKLGRPTDDSLLGLLRPPSIGTTTGGAR